MNIRLVLAAMLLISVAARAQQTPTFRTDITVVQLPVRVFDAKGNFVRDLSRADFEVLEDGIPQTISEFSLIDLSTTSKQAPANVAASGVLANADLEKLEGRLYVFLLDDAHTDMMHAARARDLIRGFIKDRMMPGDAAAVVIASGGARQDFTHDKQMLLKAVDRFTGTLDAGEPASLKQQRARTMVRLVTDLTDALGRIRGRHKTVIYVGSRVGCQVTFESVAKCEVCRRNLSSAGTTAAPDAGEQVLCNEELWDGVRAAVQANVSLYSIDPRGMLNPGWVSPVVDGRDGPDQARSRMAVTEPGRPSVLDGFYVLSDHTGGFAVTGTNNYRDSFDRIVRESSTYYLLAYTSTNDKSDGQYRRTDIKVRRAGVEPGISLDVSRSLASRKAQVESPSLKAVEVVRSEGERYFGREVRRDAD